MTSAPSVNQIRFLSSSALAKADQLILAASCSAADAMVCSERRSIKASANVMNAVPTAVAAAQDRRASGGGLVGRDPYHMVGARATATLGAALDARGRRAVSDRVLQRMATEPRERPLRAAS